MAQLTITFDVGSAAFEESVTTEVRRILSDVSDRLDGGELDGPIVDLNGNTVGQFGFH